MTHAKPRTPQGVQYLRMGRLALSIAASAVTVGMTLLVAQAGYIAIPAALTYGAAVATLCAAFYAAFASGLNRKFADPSLTVPQLVAAGLAVSYAAYHGIEARPAFMAMYLIAYSFGVFTLRTRGLLAIAAFYFACYAAVAVLSLQWQPELAEARREIFRVVLFGVVLGWMAYMASYIAELRQRLRQQAQRDGLTDAFNRRHMMSLLAVEAARAERGAALSLCLADMDNFKEINDTCGHLAGDSVLRHFAAMAKAQLRATDFVARFGGEEFLVALSQTAQADAARVAERVRAAFAAASIAGIPAGQRVTVSIGIAQHRSGESIEATLQRADAALYKAKDQGRNRVICADPAEAR
jgi:diguanylate cyclase (GGDEF)-like protein